MPRRKRTYIPGLPYHIVQRGNNREVCFVGSDDYYFYLELLKKKVSAGLNNDQYRCVVKKYAVSVVANNMTPTWM